MVEHAAVNRVVVGSSPTSGAIIQVVGHQRRTAQGSTPNTPTVSNRADLPEFVPTPARLADCSLTRVPTRPVFCKPGIGMKKLYRLFRRGGRYYAEHVETRKQTSLQTGNEAETMRLVAATRTKVAHTSTHLEPRRGTHRLGSTTNPCSTALGATSRRKSVNTTGRRSGTGIAALSPWPPSTNCGTVTSSKPLRRHCGPSTIRAHPSRTASCFASRISSAELEWARIVIRESLERLLRQLQS